jgi:PilZ domain
MTTGPSESRKSVRRRTLKAGKVILPNGSVIDCSIRDMSETGAQLGFAGIAVLPPHFELLIVSSETRMPAELVWHRGLKAGVRFRL